MISTLKFNQLCDKCENEIEYNNDTLGLHDNINLFLDRELQGKIEFNGISDEVICINCIRKGKREVRRK